MVGGETAESKVGRGLLCTDDNERLRHMLGMFEESGYIFLQALRLHDAKVKRSSRTRCSKDSSEVFDVRSVTELRLVCVCKPRTLVHMQMRV